MFTSAPGVKRPVLYILAAVISVALVVPLAAGSGQFKTGGIFDECYHACSSAPSYAQAD